MPNQDPRPTRERLLDSAEAHFASHGDGASLRDITTAAGANLASVSYHFGSKEGLLRAVLARRLEPINAARLALLERFEQEAGPDGVLALERIIEAFVRPTLDPELAPTGNFIQIMAYLHASNEPVAERFFQETFGPLVERFLGHLTRSLPDLAPERLHLRLHFLVGATIHALMAQLAPKCPLPEGLAQPLPPELFLDEVVQFCAAGFRHG